MTVIEEHILDREGHELIIHDADEAKLAALGKKRILDIERQVNDRGNGTKL